MMSGWRNSIAPAVMGAVLLFGASLLIRAAVDPSCSPRQAEHARRLQQSEQTLLRLSSLTRHEQCLFYRERAALTAEQIKPGDRCFGPGRNGDALKRQTEARLYRKLADSCAL